MGGPRGGGLSALLSSMCVSRARDAIARPVASTPQAWCACSDFCSAVRVPPSRSKCPTPRRLSFASFTASTLSLNAAALRAFTHLTPQTSRRCPFKQCVPAPSPSNTQTAPPPPPTVVDPRVPARCRPPLAVLASPLSQRKSSGSTSVAIIKSKAHTHQRR